MDLTPYGLTGKAVEKLLDAAHITANKNTIPNDPQSPFVTSGIRLGTPCGYFQRSEHRGHGSGGRSHCPGHQGRRRAGSRSQSHHSEINRQISFDLKIGRIGKEPKGSFSYTQKCLKCIKMPEKDKKWGLPFILYCARISLSEKQVSVLQIRTAGKDNIWEKRPSILW